MDYIMDPFRGLQDMTSNGTILKGFIAIILSFLLCLLITYVYKKTHKGRRYSQSFVHTMIMMSVVVSLIMIVIGNNVAVAFGLVGAFSIIRFRTAMGDPKDIAFIFFSMAAGIACGLGFYLLAVVFTVSVCAIVYYLYSIDYGSKGPSKTLRVTIPENLHYEGLFDDVFREHLEYCQLIGVETTNLGTMLQLEYEVQSRSDGSDKALIDAIRERNANLKVSLSLGRGVD